MIVHDLKSPLTGVLANAQFLLESAGLEGDRLESLKDVVTSSHTMHRMVMDLLDVARSEDGALIPRRTSVNLAALLEECSASFRGQSRQSRHELVIDIGGNTSSVEADKDLLRRVFENFLDNAAKYAPSGTAIRIEVRREVEGRLLFRVRDRGPGIPEEYRTKIFQQYTQIDHSAHVRTSRGVGLAFCRLAVEGGNETALAIASECGYVPSEPPLCAALLALGGRWAEFEAFDLERVYLRGAYEAASPEMRRRLAALVPRPDSAPGHPARRNP